MPPTTMKVIWRSDADTPNSTGSMKPTVIASSPPATPAKAADSANAASRTRRTETPSACAACGLWRTASNSRPTRDASRLRAVQIANAQHAEHDQEATHTR